MKTINWEKIADDLYEALNRTSTLCENLSHQSGCQHDWGEVCPVEMQIDHAIENYEQAKRIKKEK